MIASIVGRRCASVRILRHQRPDRLPSEAGPIEFTWDDDTTLTLDANTDWTLDLSSEPWADPLAGAAEAEREALSDLGVWRAAPIPSDLGQLVGQVVTSAEPDFNELGELVGLRLAFESDVLLARVLGGELHIEVSDR